MIQLSDEQAGVAERVLRDIRQGEMEVTIGGHAGVGKSVLASFIRSELPNFKVAAYTGKAANVLRSKGIDDASTIHSLIYYQHEDQTTGKVSWVRRMDLDCDGIIIDEASMVPGRIYEDLLGYEKPIIFIGDHAQLPPIESDFNLMKNPKYTLTTLHRNAGDIARFAMALRLDDQAEVSAWSKRSSEEVQFVRRWDVDDNLLRSVDQVACAFNKTRVAMNRRIREWQGPPQVGERVICLKNNHALGIFNGMQGRILELEQERGNHYLSFLSDQDIDFNGIRYDPDQFGQIYLRDEHKRRSKDSAKPRQGYEERKNPFDFAYCCTVHKLQGDEADRVLVIVEKSDLWEQKRWSYTAATRAKKRLVWVT